MDCIARITKRILQVTVAFRITCVLLMIAFAQGTALAQRPAPTDLTGTFSATLSVSPKAAGGWSGSGKLNANIALHLTSVDGNTAVYGGTLSGSSYDGMFVGAGPTARAEHGTSAVAPTANLNLATRTLTFVVTISTHFINDFSPCGVSRQTIDDFPREWTITGLGDVNDICNFTSK